MSGLLYFAGFVIGVTFFIYILSKYESGKEKIKRMKDGNPPVKPEIEPSNISFYKNQKRPPGTRMCPICGSDLTKYEALYASQVNSENGSKIMIYGCRHCYKPKEDPEQVKKSEY